jgi:hypothetical protein
MLRYAVKAVVAKSSLAARKVDGISLLNSENEAIRIGVYSRYDESHAYAWGAGNRESKRQS